MKRDWLVVGFIILIIAGGVLYKNRLSDKPAESLAVLPAKEKEPITPAPVPTTAPPVGASEKQEKAASEVTKAAIEKIEDSRDFFCDWFEKFQKFPVPSGLLLPILKKEVHQFVLPKEVAACLEGHQQVTLLVGSMNQDPHFIYAIDQEIPIIIDEIKSFESMDKIGDKVLVDNQDAKYRGRLLALMEPFFKAKMSEEPVSVVSFQGVPPLTKKFYYFSPATHPFATNVTAAEAKTLVKEGAVVLDTRLREEHKTGSDIENSIFLYPGVKKLKSKLLSANDIEEQGVVLYPNSKIVNKDIKIVLAGQNQLDLTAYNTISLLHKSGYTNLYYLRGGIDEWQGTPLHLPKNLKKITLIDFEKFSQMSNSEAEIIDVRTATEFAKETIPGASSIPYIQRVDKFGYPLLKEIASVPADELFATDYAFPQIRGDKGKNIILFGRHELDLAPFKAAKILESRGYQKIFILDGGWKAWSFADKIRRKKKTARGADKASTTKSKNNSLAKSANNKIIKIVEPKRLDKDGVLQPKPLDPVRGFKNGKRRQRFGGE